MISSPSTTLPSRATASTRSPSPSNAKPRSCPPSRMRSTIGSRWVEPQPALMFTPSGSHADHVDLGAQPLEQQRRRSVGRAVRAVEQDAPAGERAARSASPARAGSRRRAPVSARTRPQVGGSAPGARAPPACTLRLDGRLCLVGQLAPVRVEELDPVVVVGVVRGGDHRAQVEPVAAHEDRRGRRRQHAGQQRLPARRGDAGAQRRLEHLARDPRVAHDQHLR